jgi:acyl-CoA dehydrogenase
MDFALTEEQQLIIETTREFVETELYPHEQQVDATGELDESLRQTPALVGCGFGKASGKTNEPAGSACGGGNERSVGCAGQCVET